MTMGVIIRAAFAVLLIALVFLSQRFWLRKLWSMKNRLRQGGPRRLAEALVMSLALLLAAGFVFWRSGLLPRGSWLGPLLGLWFGSALFAYLAVKAVHAVHWLWQRLMAARRPGLRSSAAANRSSAVALASGASSPREALPDPSRRYFFQTAARLAGAVPFVGALYGFASGRLHFAVERVELPLPGLPPALDGLRIAQLSDIHIGAYMPPEQVRRAADIANDLAPDLIVLTGDFVTGSRDPLRHCVRELATLRAPLGVWGCLGNHEIYAECEDLATQLFRDAGIRILRRENAELRWNGAALNLLGVDYQRTWSLEGRPLPMLAGVEPLLRRDVPNILLSHNPNAFPRAAELGIELTLAGHTHGGQIAVEILERNLSPARFVTDFVAGLYTRARQPAHGSGPERQPATSLLYVNRGLGTVGAPVRLGASPEITLLTLRRS